METANEKKIDLLKVKLLNNGGIDIHYCIGELVGAEICKSKYHIESLRDVHHDLRICFTRLRNIIGKTFNFTSEITENIDVIGLSIAGKNENVGVVLVGLFHVLNDMKTTLSTPRIKLMGKSFGFEQELNEIISTISSEVYCFLFKNKTAELEPFFNNIETENEHGFNQMADFADKKYND